MKKRIIAACIAAFALSGSAQAALLSDLIANGTSITAGDKVFADWSLIFEGTSDGREGLAQYVDVVGIDEPGADYGLRFNFLQGAFNVIGDGEYAYLDFMFGFSVTATAPGMRISGSSLAFGGGGAFNSWQVDGEFDVGVYVRETVGTSAEDDDLATKDIEFSRLQSDLDEIPFQEFVKLSDSASFDPQAKIWVTKNILVWAQDEDDGAGLFGFEQRFSQTSVPEPASLALLGIGLFGLAAARKRKAA